MNYSANKFHFILNSALSSGDQLNWPLCGNAKTRVFLSFNFKIKMWMVKNLAVKMYPLGIHRNSMHNKYSYQEHKKSLKRAEYLLTFNKTFCCKWRKCFSTQGVPKHCKQRELLGYPHWGGKQSSFLRPPPIPLGHLSVLTKCLYLTRNYWHWASLASV